MPDSEQEGLHIPEMSGLRKLLHRAEGPEVVARAGEPRIPRRAGAASKIDGMLEALDDDPRSPGMLALRHLAEMEDRFAPLSRRVERLDSMFCDERSQVYQILRELVRKIESLEERIVELTPEQEAEEKS